MVAQFAKLKGLKFIGSAGSDEKVKWLAEKLGLDHAFNYMKIRPLEALKQRGLIGICWNNVDGEAAIAHSAGRIIICEQISGYDGREVYVKNTMQIIMRRFTVHGLLVLDHVSQFA